MALEKNMFQRAIPTKDLAGGAVTEVWSSKRLEEDFFGPAADAPVNRMLAKLRAHGVEEDKIGQYVQAVRAFFEYPSLTKVNEFRTDFNPSEGYFGPLIRFSEKDQIPDILRELRLKPKLSKTSKESLQEISVQGTEVLLKLKLVSGASDQLSAEQKFLVQINRLMYALHEPIHVTQGVGSGDRLNLLITELGVRDVLDTSAAREVAGSKILDGNSSVSASIPMREDLEQGILGLPAAWNKWNEQADGGDRSVFLVSQYESMMDALSEDALKPFLEKQPVYLLWAHNMLSSLVEALRTLREESLKFKRAFSESHIHEKQEFVDLEERKELTDLQGRLLTLVGFIAPSYFTVFQTSEEFLPYIQSQKGPALLNKHIVSNVVKTQPFDRMEIENLASDVTALLHASDPYEQRTFPISGREHLISKSEGVSVATEVGAKIAGKIIAGAADRKLGSIWVQDFFQRLHEALGNDGWETEQDVALQDLQAELRDKIGLEMRVEEFQEMYGIYPNLEVKLGSTYVRQHAIRKIIFQELEARHPEEVGRYIRGMFFVVDLQSYGLRLYSLVGFWDWDRQTDIERRKIEQNKSLGIFGLDVTRLSVEEREGLLDDLSQFSIRTIRNSGFPVPEFDPEVAKQLLRKMAEWKRRQKQEDAALAS